jgi:hypothetical protein
MERDGVASVWLGNAPSEKALREILRVAYTDDGDAIISSFALAFDTDDNDPDFSEWTYRNEATRNVRELISPHSYGDQIAPQIVAKIGEHLTEAMNGVIVWHNFEYNGTHFLADITGVSLAFVGTAIFDPN